MLGGALKQGVLKVGDDIEIRPGRDSLEKNRRIWNPILTKIVGLKSGGISLEEVGPGGSIGVLTSLDPSIVFSDKLSGNIAGLVGKLPPTLNELSMEVHLLQRVIGSKQELNVEPIKIGEALMLNVNSAATIGQVSALGKNQFTCNLRLPVCAEEKSRVTISRRVGARWRLVGYGIIVGEMK